MSIVYKMMAVLCIAIITHQAAAQSQRRGSVMDAITREPVYGASVTCCDCKMQCMTNGEGVFSMGCDDCKKIYVSFVGYQSQQVLISQAQHIISLVPAASLLNEIVVSANRETIKRSQAPVAISSINANMMQDAKAITVDQLLGERSIYDKLGNEQHQMSIRQPMTTKSLFLYLEDGIPIRTTGIFNHNALLEMNMSAVKTIEVIKGPSSSLYGREAIGGVVNFITQSPAPSPIGKLYRLNGFEVWLNVINATDNYYAYIAGKTNWGYSYTPAEPRHYNLGVSYDFVSLFKK